VRGCSLRQPPDGCLQTIVVQVQRTTDLLELPEKRPVVPEWMEHTKKERDLQDAGAEDRPSTPGDAQSGSFPPVRAGYHEYRIV